MGAANAARRRPSWRTGPALVAGSLWTLVLAAVMTLCPRRWRSPELTNRLLRMWSQGWLIATGAHVVVEGARHLEGLGACVVVSNHQSNLDPIVLTWIFRGRIRILTKRELFGVPVLGSALRTVGMVEVDRDSPDRATIAAGAAHALDQDLPLLVFPEGTTSRTGDLLPFKPGAFQIAVSHGVPVLPVLVTDSREVWPAKRLKVRSATVRVVVTAPMATEGLAESDAVALRAQLRSRLEHAQRVRAEGPRSSLPCHDGAPPRSGTRPRRLRTLEHLPREEE